MIGRLRAITIDCPDAGALAGFYSELLGLPVIRRDPDWAQIDGASPAIDFQQVEDHRTPAWPDPERPQQVHFEIGVGDIEAAQERVLALGPGCWLCTRRSPTTCTGSTPTPPGARSAWSSPPDRRAHPGTGHPAWATTLCSGIQAQVRSVRSWPERGHAGAG